MKPKTLILMSEGFPVSDGGQNARQTRAVKFRTLRTGLETDLDLPRLLRKWAAASTPLLDISAGDWRRIIYSREEDWPAAMPLWERRKFLTHAGGEKVLLKFAGLGVNPFGAKTPGCGHVRASLGM